MGFAWFGYLYSLRGLHSFRLNILSHRWGDLLPLVMPFVPFTLFVCVPLVTPFSVGGHIVTEIIRREYKLNGNSRYQENGGGILSI